MSGITIKVVETAGDMLSKMLRIYQDKLDRAYLRSDRALTVDLKTTFKPADNGDMEVDTSINFVTDRIKNKFSRTVTEKQDELFDKKIEDSKSFVLREKSIPSHWWPSCPDCRIELERAA